MKSSNRMHPIRVFKFPVTPEVSHDRVFFFAPPDYCTTVEWNGPFEG